MAVGLGIYLRRTKLGGNFCIWLKNTKFSISFLFVLTPYHTFKVKEPLNICMLSSGRHECV